MSAKTDVHATDHGPSERYTPQTLCGLFLTGPNPNQPKAMAFDVVTSDVPSSVTCAKCIAAAPKKKGKK